MPVNSWIINDDHIIRYRFRFNPGNINFRKEILMSNIKDICLERFLVDNASHIALVFNDKCDVISIGDEYILYGISKKVCTLESNEDINVLFENLKTQWQLSLI